jgi:hypothetical protein
MSSSPVLKERSEKERWNTGCNERLHVFKVETDRKFPSLKVPR